MSPTSDISCVMLTFSLRSGIGKDLALAALARGDKVIATARGRTVSKLDDLKKAGAATLELDVTSPLEKIHEAAKEAIGFYGQVDVVVNNAGMGVCFTHPKDVVEKFGRVHGSRRSRGSFVSPPYLCGPEVS